MPVEGWAIILAGDAFDLDDLRLALKRPFDPWVEDYDDDGTPVLLLRSEAWASLTTARELMDDATRLIDHINAAAMLNLGDSLPVSLGRIIKFKTDGSLDRVLIAATGKLTLAGSRVRARGVSVGALPSQPAPSPMQERLKKAATTDEVSDVFAFLVRADNWFDLYKAMESMESLVGGEAEMKKHCVQWKRVKQAANYARHSPARRFTLPADPPSLDEACKIVFAAAAQLI